VLSRTPRAPRHRNTAATGARPLFTWVAVVVTAMLALQPLPAVAAEPTTPPTAAPGELVVQLVTPTGYVPAAGLGAPDFTSVVAYAWPDSGIDVQAEADANGVLRFTGLTPGDYHVNVGSVFGSDLAGGSWRAGLLQETGFGVGGVGDVPQTGASDDPSLITVDAAGTVVSAQLRVLPVARGVVLDADALPLAGATVNDAALTASDGTFVARIDPSYPYVWVDPAVASGARAGLWKADDETAVQWSSDATALTVDDGVVTPAQITVRLARGATISGTITTPDGQPAAGVSVWTNGDDYGDGETDAEGRYTIGGLASGTYTLSVANLAPYGIGGYIGLGAETAERDSARQVVATEGSVVTGIDARLRLGGAIGGSADGLAAGSSLSASAYNSAEGRYLST